MKHLKKAALLLFVSLFLAGCAEPAENLGALPASSELPVSSAAQSEGASGGEKNTTPRSPVTVGYQTVLPESVNDFPLVLEDGTHWFARCMSTGGGVYGYTSGSNGKHSVIVRCTPSTGATEILDVVTEGFWPQSIRSNDSFVLWVEYSNPYYNDGSVFLYDLNTGEKTDLYVADRQKQQSAASPIGIALDEHTAYWTEPENGEMRLIAYDLKSGARETIRQNASRFALSDELLAWIGLEEDGKTRAVYLENRASGEVRQLTSGEAPAYLTVWGDTLVYSGGTEADFFGHHNKMESPTRQLVLFRGNKKEVLEASANSNYEYMDLALSGGFLLWQDNAPDRLYSIKENKMISFPSENGSFVGNGRYLFWSYGWNPEIEPTPNKEEGVLSQGYLFDLSTLS